MIIRNGCALGSILWREVPPGTDVPAYPEGQPPAPGTEPPDVEPEPPEPGNEVQRLEITNSPGSGNFTAQFDGSEWTPPIPRHPAAGELQGYLTALSTIGVGNLVVSKESNWVYILSYQGALGHKNLPELVVDDSNLPAGAEVIVTTVTEGQTKEDAMT